MSRREITPASFYNQEKIAAVAADCRAGKIGCVECKRNLGEKLNNLLAPLREKREKIDPAYIEEVIVQGDRKACAEASATLALVKEALQI